VLLNYADGVLRGDWLNCEVFAWGDAHAEAASDASALALPEGSLPAQPVPAWHNRAAPAAAVDILRCHEHAYVHRLLKEIGQVEAAEPRTVDLGADPAADSADVNVGSAQIQLRDVSAAAHALQQRQLGRIAHANADASASASAAPALGFGSARVRVLAGSDYVPPAHLAQLRADGYRSASVGDTEFTHALLHSNALAHAVHHTARDGGELVTAGAVVRDANGAPVLLAADAPAGDLAAPMPALASYSRAASLFTPPKQPLGYLDGDTSVSRHSFTAALHAAGVVIDAVDQVMRARTLAHGVLNRAFCVVRPPGHHAGPTGIVYNDDRVGASHGFCLFNNVAVAAAYAKCVFRDRIRRVAVIDFDVHHGNGTEAIIRNLKPHVEESRLSDDFTESITIRRNCFKPWLDWDDADQVLFASVHGFRDQQGPWFYPGSGKTSAGVGSALQSAAVTAEELPAALTEHAAAAGGEVELAQLEAQRSNVVNVGLGQRRQREWRQVWRHAVLPALLEHKPDLIFVSAGFDAHKRDDINAGYVGVDEDDFYWLTKQLVKVANTTAEGRIVSALEGGYRIHGKVASPFAQAVAAHVRALNEPCTETWDAEAAASERAAEDASVEARATVQRLRAEQYRREREEWQRRQREAQEAQASGTAAGAAADAPAPMPVLSSPDSAAGGRPRRARAPVDYVALNAEMERQKQEKKKQRQG
jgi:acetoin utilization deacetylase AcuC-like enzyme